MRQGAGLNIKYSRRYTPTHRRWFAAVKYLNWPSAFPPVLSRNTCTRHVKRLIALIGFQLARSWVQPYRMPNTFGFCVLMGNISFSYTSTLPCSSSNISVPRSRLAHAFSRNNSHIWYTYAVKTNFLLYTARVLVAKKKAERRFKNR